MVYEIGIVLLGNFKAVFLKVGLIILHAFRLILTYVLYTHLAVNVAYARAYNIYLITIVVRVICLSLK